MENAVESETTKWKLNELNLGRSWNKTIARIMKLVGFIPFPSRLLRLSHNSGSNNGAADFWQPSEGKSTDHTSSNIQWIYQGRFLMTIFRNKGDFLIGHFL